MACREIDLIVIHCSATRTDRCFTEHDLEAAHRRRGFNGCGYHFYIRKNGDIKPCAPSGGLGRMHEAATHVPSASAMRADWTKKGGLPIRVQGGSAIRCACWCAHCCWTIRAAASADIGTLAPT